MPWNNQNGGGGPWKPSGQGPWGQGNGGGNGNTPPDIEELMNRVKERFGQLVPGGGFSSGGVVALLLVGAIVWGLMGFYTVGPNEVALKMTFGQYTGKTGPGLNYNWPYPVGSVEKLAVTNQNLIDVGATVGNALGWA